MKTIPKYIFFISVLVFISLGLVSMVARVALVIIAIYIILGACYSIHHVNKPLINGITLLLILNTLYFLVSDKEIFGQTMGHTNTFGFYANIFLNLGVFYTTYWMAKTKKLNDNDMLYFFYLMVIASVFRFVHDMTTALETYNTNRTLNIGYLFVSLVPYLIFVKKKYISIPILLLLFFLILSTVKRGAVLVFCLSALYYAKIMYLKPGVKNVIVAVISLVVIVVVGYYLLGNILENNSLFLERYELTKDGFTNGRDTIYSKIWSAWFNSDSIMNLLFGFGFCSSVGFAGNYAHNDWLELLSTAGLLGIMIYVLYYLQFISILNNKTFETDAKHMLILILVASFITSLTSMCYCDVDHVVLTLLLGYIIGKNEIKGIVQWKKRRFLEE